MVAGIIVVSGVCLSEKLIAEWLEEEGLEIIVLLLWLMMH